MATRDAHAAPVEHFDPDCDGDSVICAACETRNAKRREAIESAKPDRCPDFPTCGPEFGACPDCLATLPAPTLAHVSNSHEPGTLYDCPACEAACAHAPGEGDEWCVASTHPQWRSTRGVSCGDVPISEYQTDGKPIPGTAPHGTWVRMRGADRDGRIRTFARAADAWAEEWESALMAGVEPGPRNPHYHCSSASPAPCPTGEHTNPHPNNASVGWRALIATPTLADVITTAQQERTGADSPASGETCERCGAVVDEVDPDSGLCPDCEANNASRVIL